MLQAKWGRIAAVAGLGLLAGAAAGRASGERPTTYVWLFSATGTEAENLSDMITKEFEEALGKTGCLPIVERRNYPDLESHQKQERRIAGADLSPREKKELSSTTKATAVVFGEITDDIQGGQIKVAVILETLTGAKLVNTSVRFTRGKRFDAEERERQMAELASEVCGALGAMFENRRLPDPPGQAQPLGLKVSGVGAMVERITITSDGSGTFRLKFSIAKALADSVIPNLLQSVKTSGYEVFDQGETTTARYVDMGLKFANVEQLNTPETTYSFEVSGDRGHQRYHFKANYSSVADRGFVRSLRLTMPAPISVASLGDVSGDAVEWSCADGGELRVEAGFNPPSADP